MVKELKTKEEFDEALKSSKFVIVDFTATWCPPCKYIAPKYIELSEKYGSHDVKFYKCDVDQNEEAAKSQKISAMPTFKIYSGGNEAAEIVGAAIGEVEDKIKEVTQG